MIFLPFFLATEYRVFWPRTYTIQLGQTCWTRWFIGSRVAISSFQDNRDISIARKNRGDWISESVTFGVFFMNFRIGTDGFQVRQQQKINCWTCISWQHRPNFVVGKHFKTKLTGAPPPPTLGSWRRALGWLHIVMDLDPLPRNLGPMTSACRFCFEQAPVIKLVLVTWLLWTQ